MIKNIIIFILSIIIGLILIIIGYFSFFSKDSQLIKPFLPKTMFSIENAPSQTLTGEVASISGNVSWLSRTANYAILINSAQKLQQGEEINTQNNGEAILNFSKVVNITVLPNTQVSFIQTLPANFVVEQKQGLATYEKNGEIPVSIRTLDLLINIEKGSCQVLVNKDTSDITVSVITGSVTVAFNDTNINTNIQTISEGKKYQFNNDTKNGIIRPL
jgi:uncharacterized membrane protein YkgB